MKTTIAALAIALALATNMGAAAAAGQNHAPRDARLLPITRSELVVAINHTPLSARPHEVLISRANHSHLIDVAYEQYTAVWQKMQTSAIPNLLRGEAALEFWQDSRLMKPAGTDWKTWNELFQVARTCLAAAVKLDPKSAPALREDGHFLWQYDYQLDPGLSLMKRAAAISPTDPVVHMRLAGVYLNPSTHFHNLPRARAELQTAIRLDPTYAVPRGAMKEVYRQLGNEAARKRAHAEYMALVPVGSDVTGVITDH